MSEVNRFTAALIQSPFGFNRAVMTPCDFGDYVTHQSHIEIVRALQAQIDALEAMQKQKVFKPNFNWLVDNADKVRDAVESFHSERVQSRFMVITDDMLNQPAPKADPVDELIPSVSQARAFCTEASGECFTAGKIYDISTDSHDSIRVCGDNLVSDLDEVDWWQADRVMGYRGVFAVKDGFNSARFQIVVE